MNFTQNQISTITRSNYSCSTPSSDLNYPSFIALYTNKTSNTLVQEFQRVVTNVGDAGTSYKVQVTAPSGSTVTVYPTTLVFGQKYEKQSYSLTIQYKGNTTGAITFGSITWIEDNGKHIVRSPIVVSPMIPVW
ncbi:UNVERIFIED_CONTAM: Subtilisin-like protease SBT3 [Sesamum calycinum]